MILGEFILTDPIIGLFGAEFVLDILSLELKMISSTMDQTSTEIEREREYCNANQDDLIELSDGIGD